MPSWKSSVVSRPPSVMNPVVSRCARPAVFVPFVPVLVVVVVVVVLSSPVVVERYLHPTGVRFLLTV